MLSRGKEEKMIDVYVCVCMHNMYYILWHVKVKEVDSTVQSPIISLLFDDDRKCHNHLAQLGTAMRSMGH